MESIQFDCNILVGDFGSSDDTLEICRSHKAEIINLPWVGNYSKSRNNLVAKSHTDWQLFIDPWEHIASGQLGELVNPSGYKVYNIQGDVITKQTRIWKKDLNKFVNPVYETLQSTESELLPLVITGSPPNKFAETINILNEWKSNCPHVAEIEYYLALTYLTNGWCDEFLRYAEHFMFRFNEETTSRLLIHYYYAIVQLLHKKNYNECIKHVTHCLVKQPTIAEFWCLLGDAFYKMKQWHRAIAFYDNASIFGTRRIANDEFPIEVSKYKEYPDSMILTCKSLVEKMYQPGGTNNSSIITVT